MSKAVTVTMREVWESGEGDFHWTVGPDGEGLQVVEVAYIEGEKVHSAITASPAVARAIAAAILKCADELEGKA